jgi:chromate transport protein ChrA
MATVSAISSPSQESKSKEASSFQKDAENEAQEGESSTTSNPILAENEADMEDNSNVPKMSLLKLFWFVFYNFGLFAWGGPVAQIALIKERLVIQDKWITLARFQRVFAVYQILPGPEAAELCMFFGCLSAGRLGGVNAGIAFMLPGFVLMLLASYLYSLAGLENKYFNASFRALQPIVAAMVPLPTAHCLRSANILLTYRQILKATHKIADHSVISHTTKKIDAFLIIAAICTAINGALHINM